MLLLILPRHGDLAAGQVVGSKAMGTLLQSLTPLTGTSPKFLMSYMDIADVNIENYYLLPEDQHPSVVGSEAFAKAIVGVLKDRLETANARRQD